MIRTDVRHTKAYENVRYARSAGDDASSAAGEARWQVSKGAATGRYGEKSVAEACERS